MSDEQQPDSTPPSLEPMDPIAAMVAVGLELHEMYLSLCESGFTKKEALYLVGQAVAAGVMLPNQDFGPDDFDDLNITIVDDDSDFDDDDDDFGP